MQKQNSNKGMSRRSFIATMAVAGGAALAGNVACTPQAESPSSNTVQAPEEQIYQGLCRGNCGGGCYMNVHVREGKIVKTSVKDAPENPLEKRLCQRGLTHAQRVYAPERLKYPMRRVEGTERGAGQWEQISWEEAISYVGDKWKGYVDEFGGSSIGVPLGGGVYTNDQFYTTRFQNLLGMTKLSGQYDQNGLVMGSLTVTRGPMLHGNGPLDMLNAKNIFVWGCNATISEQPRWPIMQEAMERGANVVVIDPIYQGIAQRANAWIPVRAASDGALALAMMNVIVNEGLTDPEYLAKGTVAPFLVKESDGKYLRMSDLGIEPTEGPVDPRTGKPTVVNPIVARSADGVNDDKDKISNPVIEGSFEVNGIAVKTAYQRLLDRIAEYPPESVADICDVPVEKIKELARTFADGPSVLYLQFGTDHWTNGAETFHAIITLGLITGNMSKSGAGIQGGMGGSAIGSYGVNLSGGLSGEGFKYGITASWENLPDIIRNKANGAVPINLKSILIEYNNPISNAPGRTEIMESLKDIELLVCMDSVLTESAQYCDVILPTTHWFEMDTFTAMQLPFYRINEKAVEPAFEAKCDIEVIKMLADHMGYGDKMMSEDEWYTLLLTNDVAKNLEVTWESLKKDKLKRIMPDDYIFYPDYKYPSPTGRAEFYFETLQPNDNYGQVLDHSTWSLPHWQPPVEAWYENPLFEKYPLNIMTHRDRFKTHTIFALCPWLEELRPEPILYMNPEDAEARGIENNDYARAFNDRGSVVMRVHLSSGNRPGVVTTQHTWYKQSYREGHYADLTSRAMGKFLAAGCFYDTLCEVEKV
jgi:molybdopterin-containing oxidoreductase family molybdopterin binding subunit